MVLTCDLIIIELLRLAPNEVRAREMSERLEAFELVKMSSKLWQRAREAQVLLAADGNHRRVPPADLLIAVAAAQAGVPLVHYDRDYDRIGSAIALDHRWFVPDGSLA